MSALACSRPGCNAPRHIGKDMCIECYKQHGDYTFGMDSAIRAKIAAKFDPDKAAQAQAWLEALSGEVFPGDFGDSLKDGRILCKAVNTIRPGSVRKINESKMAFKQMENINFYLDACKALGQPDTDVFVTRDLYEAANLGAVVDQLFSLGGLAHNIQGFNGPYLGPRHSTEAKRNFTAAQLRASSATQSRQTAGGIRVEPNARTDLIIKNVSGGQASGEMPLLAQGGIHVERNARTDHIIKNVSGAQASSEVPLLAQGAIHVERNRHTDQIIKNVDELKAQTGSAQASSGPRFCQNCGAQRAGTARFCGGCGTAF